MLKRFRRYLDNWLRDVEIRSYEDAALCHDLHASMLDDAGFTMSAKFEREEAERMRKWAREVPR